MTEVVREAVGVACEVLCVFGGVAWVRVYGSSGGIWYGGGVFV